jgi:hypothetical protein
VIRYRLQCTDAHEFDAWFASSASYETQLATSRVCCPECGSRAIGKAIMSPHIATGRGDDAPALGSPDCYNNIMRDVRRVLLAGSEDVGDRFTEEARRIHYRETKARSICGTACIEDAQALVEEGIEVLPVPRVRDDAN